MRADRWQRSVDELVGPLRGLIARLDPTVVGLAGPPGSGKTTLARELAAVLGPRAVQVSMDDYYLSRSEREAKGLRFRGGPGSHDLPALVAMLDDIRERRAPVTVVRYDTHADDRASPDVLDQPPRPLIFDGYFLGYDRDGYADVRDRVDLLVFFDVDAATARARRFERERALRDEGGGMSDADMQAFWDDVLWPGIERLVPVARANADLVLTIGAEQRVTRVEVAERADDVLRVLSAPGAP